jgi:hypothetical protein
MKILQGIFFVLLCLGVTSCADRNVGMALGVGSRGAGAALFTDNAWVGAGPFGGIMLGFGNTLSGESSGYSSGKIVYRQADGESFSGASRNAWYKDYVYPSPLAAYRLTH